MFDPIYASIRRIVSERLETISYAKSPVHRVQEACSYFHKSIPVDGDAIAMIRKDARES